MFASTEPSQVLMMWECTTMPPYAFTHNAQNLRCEIAVLRMDGVSIFAWCILLGGRTELL